MPIKSPALFVALSAVSALVVAAEAEPPPPPDTSKWVCKFCPDPEEGYRGEVELGVGYLSDDSLKFGEYTGLTDKGGYLIGNGQVRYGGEDAYYADVAVRDLGFDARSLRVENGRQGKYKLLLTYDEIPHFLSDSARTPFRGGDSLTLPPGWVSAGTTAGMTALPGALRDVELETSRKRIGLGAVLPARRWEYAAAYRHETREGRQRLAGSFFFNAAELIQPIDYTTDEIDLSASFTAPRLQARIAYHASLFKNGNESLTWANPFTPIVAGADAGQLAAAPDNQFHQLRAALGYQVTKATRASAELALGRLTQDEDFLSPTLNPNLVVPALPRSSLDGRVDTLIGQVKLVSELSERLGVSAAYRYEDRDNETQPLTLPWVTTDAFVNAPRTTRPYSFTRGTTKLAADYRFAPRVKGSVGLDHDTHERTLQEVAETRETTLWGKLVTRAREGVDLLFNVAHGKRDGDRYEVVPETTPPQNPLLRKYNLAHRERDLLGMRATMAAGERVTVGTGIEWARDDYTDSAIGLTDSREVTLSLDAAAALSDRTSAHAFAHRQTIVAHQAGSGAFSAPDWTARNDDTVHTLGVGLKHALIEERLDVGADYAVSLSRGEVTVADAAFPDRRAHLRSLKLHGSYQIKEQWSLHAAYWYERFHSDDWALDGVTPTTIPSVLTLGETSPDYDVSFVSVSVRYRF